MTWNDEFTSPSPQGAPATLGETPISPAEASHSGRTSISGLRRGLMTAALAIGLLVVGGGAAVLAASPDPSASTAPGASTPATGGSGSTQHQGNCPAKGSGSGSGSGSRSTPTTPTTPATPTAPDATTAPSSDLSSPEV
jgi:hypothetical protein